jgi:hypothetical protein
MPRSVLRLSTLLTTLAFAGPALSADWEDGLRDAYPDDWALEEENPISIELGLRYWYSKGGNRMTVLGANYVSDDTSHIVEGVLRIEDNVGGFYTKGFAGYSAVITNNYTTPSGPGTLNGGQIKYAGADIGYMPFGNETARGGAFVGYQYWNDSPDMGAVTYAGTSTHNDIAYQMVKLGLTGKINIGDVVDLTAEAAIVPYAQVAGNYGAFIQPAIPGETPTSPGRLQGWLYGATGEVMARVHPLENMTIGLGARAWYLTGDPDVTFSTNANNWIAKTTQFSNFRYGLLAEVGYRF